MMRSLIALIGVGGAVALFLLYTKPAYDGVQSKKTTNDAYDAALQKATELQQLKQSLLSRYNAFNTADIERLNKLLPDHVDNVKLVLELDSLASRRGIALQDYSFEYPSGGAQGASAAATIGPAREPHESVIVGFSTATTYPNFIAFLSDLEKSLRVADIEEVSFNAASSVATGEPVYIFEIALRTYWLR